MSEKKSKRTQIKPIDEVIANSENSNEIMDNKKEELIVKGIVKDCMNLNVRDKSSIDSEILGVIPKNFEVILLDDTIDGWYKIEAEGIGIGFCMSKYINVKF